MAGKGKVARTGERERVFSGGDSESAFGARFVGEKSQKRGIFMVFFAADLSDLLISSLVPDLRTYR